MGGREGGKRGQDGREERMGGREADTDTLCLIVGLQLYIATIQLFIVILRIQHGQLCFPVTSTGHRTKATLQA